MTTEVKIKAYLDEKKLQGRKKMTSDLLEENQDLRKEITELRNNVEDMKDKLTKAKEIIKAFYEDNFDEAEFYSLQRKAEQFLSEVDK